MNQLAMLRKLIPNSNSDTENHGANVTLNTKSYSRNQFHKKQTNENHLRRRIVVTEFLGQEAEGGRQEEEALVDNIKNQLARLENRPPQASEVASLEQCQ